MNKRLQNPVNKIGYSEHNNRKREKSIHHKLGETKCSRTSFTLQICVHVNKEDNDDYCTFIHTDIHACTIDTVLVNPSCISYNQDWTYVHG